MEQAKQFSKALWKAIQQEDIETLQEMIHPEAVFVHMGVTLKRDEELEVIRSKRIVYQDLTIEESSVHKMESTLIVLNKIKLTAIVGGNEVTNPFVVTEVYTQQDKTLRLASLSFTKITY